MRVEEFIEARGHTKIRGTHRTTFEFTKEAHLTERGDCIIGVRASKGAVDLSYEFGQVLQNSNSRITMLLMAGEFSEVVRGFGNQKLLLTNRTDLVVRKSDYTCGRTLMVRADKAAVDLPRGLIALLRDPMCRIQVKLTAEHDSRQR
jgi:hypothetical protein